MRTHLEKDETTTTLRKIINLYNELSNEGRELLQERGFYGFDLSAVRSLLLRYKQKDLIDVIKKNGELVLILNSSLFRKIKTCIYQMAKNNQGIVNFTDINSHFRNQSETFEDISYYNEYLKYYDQEFKRISTWLANKREQRIFWSLIQNENIENPTAILNKLRGLEGGLLEKFSLNLENFIDLSAKRRKLCSPKLMLELLRLKLIANELSFTRGYWIKNESLHLYYFFTDGDESTIFNYFIFYIRA